MRKVLKIFAGLFVAFCIFLFLISSYPLLGSTVKSPDGSFQLQSSSTVSFFAFPGQGCDGEGEIKLKNSLGKILYESGVLFGLKCMPPYIFFPKKALILGKLETTETLFVDVDGNSVIEISASDFESALQVPDADDRHSILYFLSAKKFGLTEGFFASIILRLLSTKTEKDLADAAAIASNFDLKKSNENLRRAVQQFVASDDRFISEEFFNKLYSDTSHKEYLKKLNEMYFAKDDARRIELGLGVVENSAQLSKAEKKSFLTKYFRSSDAYTAKHAMYSLVRLGLGDEIRTEIFRRYYSAKDISDYYNMPDAPGDYLNAAFLISDKGVELSKAIRFGLEHSAEGYWREAFYLVRDHDQLNDLAFVSSLLSLKTKHPEDSLLVNQVDQTISRIKRK